MEDELSRSHPRPPAKWQGTSAVMVTGATSEQVWPFLADFCSIHKWMPGIKVCRLVVGIPREPGATRYCATTQTALDGTETTKWANERLLAIDPAEKFLSYEVTDNNIGFKSYVATLRVMPSEGECRIEWGFTCVPAEGWTEEELKSYINYCLQHIRKKLEDALAPSAPDHVLTSVSRIPNALHASIFNLKVICIQIKTGA